MADGYSVGNLKIAFNAVDQTSDDFKKIATTLRAIVNLINRISTADLGKFSTNIKEITKAFNPFLTKLEKSTLGYKRLIVLQDNLALGIYRMSQPCLTMCRKQHMKRKKVLQSLIQKL